MSQTGTGCAKDPTKAEYNQSYQAYKAYQPKIVVIAEKDYIPSRCEADIQKTKTEDKRANITHKGHYPNALKAFQGGLGEYAAITVGESESLHQTEFLKKEYWEKGFDNVMQDSHGRFWIIEGKCTEKDGIAALHQDEGPDEMTTEWIADRLQRMLNPNDDQGYYKEANVPLAQQMVAAGVESFGRLVVHMNPYTLNVTVDQYVDGGWKTISTYRPKES